MLLVTFAFLKVFLYVGGQSTAFCDAAGGD
jgi:hypothetical protein